jgi:integrase
MSGHIRRRVLANGKVRYSPRITIDGREQQLGSFTLKKDAEACLRRVQREIAAGTYGRKDITFGEFYRQWFEAKSKSLKPSTWANYEHTFRLHILPYFTRRHLSKITPLIVQAWVNELSQTKLAPATIEKCYRSLRSCLKQAEAWDLIDRNPCRSIDRPRQNQEELSFLKPEEIGRVLDAAEEPERTLFAVLAFSGLRLGEALGLAWKHISFEDNAIIVERAWSYWGGFQEPKTPTSRRAVPMLPTLAGLLHEHYQRESTPAPDILLFSFGGEKPIDAANARKEFLKALNRASLKHVTLHSLRHSFASTLLASGASIKALQRSLGHASAVMTLNVYSHLIQEDLGNALLRADQLMTGAGGKVVRLDEERGQAAKAGLR